MWNQNTTMKQYLREQLSLYIFVCVLFVTGVIFGVLMVNALTLEQKQDMSQYLGSFFHMLDQGPNLEANQSFQQSFSMHMKWMTMIWILGLSVIGLPIILILDFLKGVLIGFTVGYLVGQYAWKGMLFALVSVAPQNLVIIPAIVISSVAAISFSIYVIKNRILQHRGAISQPFMSYTIISLSMCVILLGISFYEGYLSPILMKWVTPMLGSL